MDLAVVTTIAAVVQGAGTLVALGAVVVTLRHNKRDFELNRTAIQQEQRNAEAQASRTEAAARLTEDYTRRVVDALEVLAAQGLGGTAKPKVSWSLQYESGDTYRLTNTGDLTAEAVMVQAHESLGLIEGSNSDSSTLRPGEALTFLAAPDMGTTDMTITVAWMDDESRELQTWRYPLPYVPPPRPARLIV